ncbi:LysE family translocator [Pseudonocardia spinosispora]|uniref:LysE family translocator n=1 Tax=Pseudonocardia spinosispora TaxID=103441 RepID=UPI0003F821DD|nr:LysE family translocator [Pseudonocardia spinosispora]
MPLSALLGFWAVAALLIIVPGPDWAFAISAGLRGHVLPAASGIVLGYLAMTVVVAAGVGALVASSPVALRVLTVVGGAYLVWLGVSTLRHPATAPGGQERTTATRRATLARGIGVSALNPKGLLVFVAMLPQFASPGAPWPIACQLGALGLVFTLTCAAVYLVVGACARRVLHSRPSTARAVSRVSGVCMVVIGVALLVERFV